MLRIDVSRIENGANAHLDRRFGTRARSRRDELPLQSSHHSNEGFHPVRISLALLFSLTVSCSAFAQDDQQSAPQATQEEVIASAKQLSAPDCTPPKNRNGLRIAGCEYEASFLEGKWGVRVNTLFVARDGSHSSMPGGQAIYLFSAEGKFLERMTSM
jgi:hypothetical protein